MSDRPPAVILAGGRSTRMGGADKSLALLRGRPLLAHIVERLAPQAGDIAINANGDPARFSHLGLSVIPDSVADWPGPLAGILAALDWAKGRADRVLTVPADTPFIPADLAEKLGENSGLSLAGSGGRTHPVIGLWPVGLRGKLAELLSSGDTRKVTAFTERCSPSVVDFPMLVLADGARLDPFFNVNTPEDLARADEIAGLLP